jgi:hypothetical protein
MSPYLKKNQPCCSTILKKGWNKIWNIKTWKGQITGILEFLMCEYGRKSMVFVKKY